jgi:hypothetical protein
MFDQGDRTSIGEVPRDVALGPTQRYLINLHVVTENLSLFKTVLA